MVDDGASLPITPSSMQKGTYREKSIAWKNIIRPLWPLEITYLICLWAHLPLSFFLPSSETSFFHPSWRLSASMMDLPSTFLLLELGVSTFQSSHPLFWTCGSSLSLFQLFSSWFSFAALSWKEDHANAAIHLPNGWLHWHDPLFIPMQPGTFSLVLHMVPSPIAFLSGLGQIGMFSKMKKKLKKEKKMIIPSWSSKSEDFSRNKKLTF